MPALNLGTMTAKQYFYQVPQDATAASLNADFDDTFGPYNAYDENWEPVIADRFIEDEDGNILADAGMGALDYRFVIEPGTYLMLSWSGGGFQGGTTLENITDANYVLEQPT